MKNMQDSDHGAGEQKDKHPALLYIGHEKNVVPDIEQRLMAVVCKKSACKTCAPCRLIQTRQHYSVTWLTRPEKWYGRSDMAPIFHKSQFALAENERHFFVIERADLLTESAANSLLKLLEEPPRGYQFFLGAPHPQAVLPTVRSRCLITPSASGSPVAWEQLLTLFTKNPELNRFMLPFEDRSSELYTLHESQALDFVDQVYDYWTKRMIEASDGTIQARIRVLDHARCFPPMPGSTVLFLKNLYLQLFMLRHQDSVSPKPGIQRRLLSGRYVPICPFVSE